MTKEGKLLTAFQRMVGGVRCERNTKGTLAKYQQWTCTTTYMWVVTNFRDGTGRDSPVPFRLLISGTKVWTKPKVSHCLTAQILGWINLEAYHVTCTAYP